MRGNTLDLVWAAQQQRNTVKRKEKKREHPSSFPFPSSFAYAWRRGWGVQHILQHAATRVTVRLRHAYSALNTRGVEDERLKV